MLLMVRRLPLLVAASLITVAAHAGPRDPAAAEELFVEGRAAMERGDFVVACKRFEQSQELDPGAGTLINWAECLNRQGKPASSRLKWREALDALPADDERRAAASERIAALDGSVPRLEIRMDPLSPPGTTVMRDGVAVDAATLGLAIPVDPGAHRIDVGAPGRQKSQLVVTLSEGDRRVVVVNAGPVLVAPPRPVYVPVAPAPHDVPAAAWIIGGIGAASLITGATFGILAIVEKGRMEDGCPRSAGSRMCNDSGLGAARNGQTYATIANVTVPIGIAGTGLGGYLVWSSARSSAAAAPASHAAQLHFASTF
jgi:hypothetical protein